MKRLMPIALMLLTTGCASFKPSEADYVVEGYAVHQSQPMNGPGPAPIGGSGSETNYEAIGTALRVETDRYFTEMSLDYVVHENNLTGGPWLFTIKGGVRVQL